MNCWVRIWNSCYPWRHRNKASWSTRRDQIWTRLEPHIQRTFRTNLSKEKGSFFFPKGGKPRKNAVILDWIHLEWKTNSLTTIYINITNKMSIREQQQNLFYFLRGERWWILKERYLSIFVYGVSELVIVHCIKYLLTLKKIYQNTLKEKNGAIQFTPHHK